MLIEKIRDVYREVIEPAVTVKTITAIPTHVPASNAGHYASNEMQARRHRRQRRMNRAMARPISGWALRTW